MKLTVAPALPAVAVDIFGAPGGIVILPILFASNSVNQIAPSGPLVMPAGLVLYVFGSYSVI